MVRLPRNEKQTYWLNSRAQMWPWGLTLAMTLTLNFQGQIQNLLYLSQKWSDRHETKSKHIDWTLGLKCDHRVWLWPWPWPWIFKVKYRICYISAKNGQIASKWKANISIELQASNMTNGFELGHNLDLWILKVKCDLDLWPHRWPWPWIFMVKFWNSCISEWEGWLTLHKGGGSRSFMTMIMTIWWPRSGVWIYQVVTGVTSVVGVPSTHLVGSDNGLSPGRRQAIIWTNAEILLIGTLGTNFREILIKIRIFSLKKMGLNVSSAKWRPFCLGLNVLRGYSINSLITAALRGYNINSLITAALISITLFRTMPCVKYGTHQDWNFN